MSLLKSKHSGWTWDLKRTPFGGKGGGGGGSQQQPVTQQVNNTSIPSYAQPYVETMLGTAQQQIFNYDDQGNVTGMKPYVPYSDNASDYIAGFSPLQQQAQSNVANMQVPGQYNTAMNYAQTAGLGALGTANSAAQYGGMGANFGTSAANLAPQAQQYGQNAADIGTTGGLGYGAAGMNAGRQGEMSGMMGQQAGMSYGQNATNPNAVQAYMNPYLQATLNPSMQLQAQQFGQINAQNQGQATQQGAFGGGRQAVMQGLNQQNQMLAQNQLVGNAYNQAYNTANQNMQQASALGMQGAGLGIQGAQAGMQGAGVGLQGVNAAMQGQQAGLQGLQQAGNLYGQGMQGAQIGLQGVNAQQAAYGQLGNQAANLSNIAGQQTQTALGINQAQQASGAAQQAQQQNIINQAVQNYGTKQQYPMAQLANMSALLRGLPMQQTTTQTYQAAPSAVSTLGGLGATALGAYGAAGGFKGAKGGLPKDFEKVKKFDVGGAVEADLNNMDIEHLQQEVQNSPSAIIRQEAKQILMEKMAEQQAMAQGVGAATGGMQMAGGGIVAFGDPKLNPNGDQLVEAPNLTEKEMEQALYGRLSKESLERLEPKQTTKNSVEFNNLQKPKANPNEWRGPIDFLSDLYNPKRIDPKTGLALTQSEFEQGPTYPPTAPAAKSITEPAAKPVIEPAAKPSGLGGTDQAKGYGFASSTEDKDYKMQVDKLGSQIDKLTADLNKGLSSGKAQSDLDALREEIKDKQDQKLWLSLMAGGAKAMASTSPFANVGIGQGVGAGVETYAQAAKAEREDKKLLIAQQSALEQAEYARKTGNLNALIAAQTRLDQIKAHRDTLKAQYAQIGASKEATLDASKTKAYGDTILKGIASGMTEDEATGLANRIYSKTPANTISFSDLGKKKS